MLKEFLYGLSYPFRTIKFFFREPKVLLLSVVPVILNAVIYGAIFYFVFSRIYGSASKYTEYIPDGMGIFQTLVSFLIFIVSFFVVLFVCYILFIAAGGILSSPFNEAISQRIEKMKTGQVVSSSKGFFADLVISLKAELIKLFFLIAVALPLFLMGFIPIIGILFVILATIFSMFFNALDFVDYPLTRRHVKFRQKIKLLLSNKPLSFGFGATAFLITFIPGVNIVLRPVLVVAGTSLYFDKFNNESK